MDKVGSRSTSKPPSGPTPPLLAWGWLAAAGLLLAVATVLTWWQAPLPVPNSYWAQTASPWVRFWKPLEWNIHRRQDAMANAPPPGDIDAEGALAGLNNTLSSVAMADDGLRGWAVGGLNTILSTTDGGHDWLPKPVRGVGYPHSIHFSPDGMHGWLVGDEAKVHTTRDGGSTWQARATGSAIPLSAASVTPDGQSGWAVGASNDSPATKGMVMVTRNGGENWTPHPSTAGLSAACISPSGQFGWVVGTQGTILFTKDYGANWTAQQGNTPELLNAVAIHQAGARGWAVGSGGAIVATTDGGTTWQPQTSTTSAALTSVVFNPDGQRGWAVGHGGTILSTRNGGSTWQAQSSPTKNDFNAVTFNPDGLRGWVVGFNGSILATQDGGTTWAYAERYRRAPAPWYWLAVALSAALAWRAWSQRPTGQAYASVAGVAASDAEVRQAADDRLEFGGLARGISRFLRNPATRPPLTLAINGRWGSGKSSLMQLVCADLRGHGHRPIWFNAWHHQKEEHLFAALLGAVHAQAVPPWCSRYGPLFRLRLLWLRSRRHFGVLCVMVALVSFLLALSWSAFQSGGFQTATAMVAAMQQRVAPQLAAWAGLVAALTSLAAIFKGAEAFKVNPALLLTKVRDGMGLKTAAAQNDFRAQFAQQFGELVQALPYRLMIVVDDLDRCRPAVVLDVMEAVNYLTSAGDCFVMFGMDRERVQAALGLAFKEIAAELESMDSGAPAATGTDAGLAKRREYARDYLQKLVNIEITVPTAHSETAHQLLQAPEPLPRHRMQRSAQALWQLWPLALCALAVAAGVWLAGSIPQPDPEVPAPVSTASAPPSPSPPASESVAVPPVQAPIQAPLQSQASTPVGDRVEGGDVLAWLSLALLPLLAVGAVVVVRLLGTHLHEAMDSAEFKKALEIWAPVVAQKHETPRAIKRFGNRLRYLAMLQQGEAQDTTWQDVLKAAWKRRVHPGTTTAPPPPSDALAEHQLIAIGALYEVHGRAWESFLNGESHADDLAAQAFRNAVEQHQNQFDTAWPPSEEELAVFKRLVSGVRLAGDPQTLTPFARDSEAESDVDSMRSNAAPRKAFKTSPAEPA